MQKIIHRVTHILWARPINLEKVKNSEWRLSSDTADATDNVSLYERISSEGDSEIQFWSFERHGKRSCFSGSDSFFSNLQDMRGNFAGNCILSKQIICMGWQCWEDEIELEIGEAMMEGAGEDYSGELNVQKISKKIVKFQSDTVAVFRSVYRGEGVLSLETLQAETLYTPDGFTVRDSEEVARLCYRTKA